MTDAQQAAGPALMTGPAETDVAASVTVPPIVASAPASAGLDVVPPPPSGGRPPSRYTITGTLGEGGASIVYAAVDEHLGRDVAVKVFKHTISGEDSARQQVELDVLGGLSHHAIVTLLDAGIAPDPEGAEHRYLVLERVDGMDLRARIEHGPISPRHVAEIGCDLAEALEYVHTHGVIHRDLKPGNVLVVSDGENGRTRARLTDFGIALNTSAARDTLEGITTGTAAYLSPEQARGEELTGASDVYSLGLVLLECHTRTLAFPGTPVQSAMARLTADPTIPDELPEQWRRLLAAMTAREASDRPSVHELVQALRQLLIGESSRHRALVSATLPELSVTRAFDRITAIAARTLGVPVAVLGLVQGEHVRFLSYRGITGDRTIGLESLCRQAASFGAPVIIEDAGDDRRAQDAGLAVAEAGLTFFVALPIRSAEGAVIGTLCVTDTTARAIDAEQLDTLHDLVGLAALILDWDAEQPIAVPPLALGPVDTNLDTDGVSAQAESDADGA